MILTYYQHITIFIVNKAAPKVEIFKFCGLALKKFIINKILFLKTDMPNYNNFHLF